MQSTLFIPERIKVGFQKRQDTYSGKLAYVIGYDKQKKCYRKQVSWDGWVSHPTKIDHYSYPKKEIVNENYIAPEEHDNAPTSGFVLNKKVGDYKSDWNHRKAHIRIFDPRGWEFEISPENLLFILENVSSEPGKSLNGEFVYSWDGKDIVLLPVHSVDYQESVKFNDRSAKKVLSKDLILGRVYETKEGRRLVYVGDFTQTVLQPSPHHGKRYTYENSKSPLDLSWKIDDKKGFIEFFPHTSKITKVFVELGNENTVHFVNSIPETIKVDTFQDVALDEVSKYCELVLKSKEIFIPNKIDSITFKEFDLFQVLQNSAAQLFNKTHDPRGILRDLRYIYNYEYFYLNLPTLFIERDNKFYKINIQSHNYYGRTITFLISKEPCELDEIGKKIKIPTLINSFETIDTSVLLNAKLYCCYVNKVDGSSISFLPCKTVTLPCNPKHNSQNAIFEYLNKHLVELIQKHDEKK